MVRHVTTINLLFLATLPILTLLAASPAFACIMHNPREPYPFAAPGEEPPDDSISPGTHHASILLITRGTGKEQSSCASVGNIVLSINHPEEGVGYRFEVLSGELPENMEIATYEVEVIYPGNIVFTWTDGATNIQEPFAFDLAITAVDPWGRESEPFVLFIEDRGTWRGRNGCTGAGGTVPQTLITLLLLGGVLLAGRRRRVGR
jgi:hypothetical protein